MEAEPRDDGELTTTRRQLLNLDRTRAMLSSSPMSNQKTLERLFRESLLLADELDLAHVAYGDTEEWDSVAHMQLVATIETAFDVMLETDEVIAMSDFAIARDLLQTNHGIQFES